MQTLTFPICIASPSAPSAFVYLADLIKQLSHVQIQRVGHRRSGGNGRVVVEVQGRRRWWRSPRGRCGKIEIFHPSQLVFQHRVRCLATSIGAVSATNSNISATRTTATATTISTTEAVVCGSPDEGLVTEGIHEAVSNETTLMAISRGTFGSDSERN